MEVPASVGHTRKKGTRTKGGRNGVPKASLICLMLQQGLLGELPWSLCSDRMAGRVVSELVKQSRECGSILPPSVITHLSSIS